MAVVGCVPQRPPGRKIGVATNPGGNLSFHRTLTKQLEFARSFKIKRLGLAKSSLLRFAVARQNSLGLIASRVTCRGLTVSHKESSV